MTTAERVFLDAGLLIGALLRDDPRHAEARGIVIAGPPSVLLVPGS